MAAFFKKNWIYFAVNIAMAAIMAAVLLYETNNAFGFICALIRAVLVYALVGSCWILVPLMIYMSILAYKSVKKNNEDGVAYSLIGGFVGGFIAVRKNKEFSKARAVNIIFSVYLWIFVGFPAGVGLLFAIGIYDWI